MNQNVKRRDFLASAVGGLAATATGAFRQRGERGIVIDCLGEVHADYDAALLDEILGSGMRGCVVTVGNPALHSAEAFDDLKKEVADYERMIAAQPARLSRATTVADLDHAVAAKTIGLVYYTQNATPIEDNVERLRALYDLGVRIVQLTYNTRNLLGDGCLERTNTGLSKFALEVVARMNEIKMLVDVSHSGDATGMSPIKSSGRSLSQRRPVDRSPSLPLTAAA